MDFSFETLYDQRALTAVAKAIRKIFRRKNSIFMRIFGICFIAFGIYKSSPLSGNAFDFSVGGVLGYVALLMIMVAVFFEDSVNGMIARTRLPRGEFIVDAQFDEELFHLHTQTNSNTMQYQRIRYLTETKYYYIFIFNEHHAEVFEKDTLAGITDREFRQFMLDKTGKKFQTV